MNIRKQFSIVKELKFLSAFTLAEMMVVMLIMSIILAAMAPVMTTRNKLDQSSPWQWATNGSDAYFGLGSAQIAMIGQTEATVADQSARLILNNSNDKKSILFKNGNIVNGYLQLGSDSVILGTTAAGNSIQTSGIALGHNVTSYFGGINIGKDSSNSLAFGTAIGHGASTNGEESIAVGRNSSAVSPYSVALGSQAGADKGSLAFGYDSKGLGSHNVAIGYQSKVSGDNAINIGSASEVSGDNSIAIGPVNSATEASNSILIGTDCANRNADNSILMGNTIGITGTIDSHRLTMIGDNIRLNGADTIAIGYDIALGGASSAVMIGKSSKAGGESSVAIGDEAETSNWYSVALGKLSEASGSSSIAIGGTASIHEDMKTLASGTDSIAIGRGARAVGDHNVAIGDFACRYVTGSNKICIGSDSGPSSSSEWASDDEERIFIGSRSNFNNGPAVLEVHNTIDRVNYSGVGTFSWQDTGVVINGNLVVKGAILTSLADEVDLKVRGYGSAAVIGSNDHNKELKRVKADGVRAYYEKNGNFRSYNGINVSHDDNWSDRRLKYVGKESTAGLDKIRQLKVFNYTFKKDKTKTPHVGVMAQDLQKIFPDAVKKGVDGFLTIRMEDMFYAVINAVKELDARVTALEKENKILKEQNKALDARLKVIEAKLK